jgi:hypothetical protein
VGLIVIMLNGVRLLQLSDVFYAPKNLFYFVKNKSGFVRLFYILVQVFIKFLESNRCFTLKICFDAGNGFISDI